MSSLAGLARKIARKAVSPLRSEAARKAVSRAQRTLTPISPEALRAALDNAIGPAPARMLMHSSLSSCGRFTKGPGDILDALRERCGDLYLPTHTYCYPASPQEPAPLFDRDVTASKNGLLTEIFRKQPGVTRSIHSTHSLATTSTEADAVLGGHYLNDSPCGEGTPYSRLVHGQSAALMFGVHFHYYTFFHTAEFEAGSEHAYQHGVADSLRVVDETGAERVCLSRRQNWAPMRFREAGDLLEARGLVRRARLGRSALLFVPDTLKVHDFLVERLRRTPDFLRASCATPLY